MKNFNYILLFIFLNLKSTHCSGSLFKNCTEHDFFYPSLLGLGVFSTIVLGSKVIKFFCEEKKTRREPRRQTEEKTEIDVLDNNDLSANDLLPLNENLDRIDPCSHEVLSPPTMKNEISNTRQIIEENITEIPIEDVDVTGPLYQQSFVEYQQNLNQQIDNSYNQSSNISNMDIVPSLFTT